MIKRFTAALLAVVMLTAVFTSCAKKPKNAANTVTTPVNTAKSDIETDSSSFKLSYSKSDSLNPYESNTLNNQVLGNLVFESLFRLDEGYKLVPELAVGYSYADPVTIKVTIPSGREFSNGKKITASSIVYAFKEAKASVQYSNALRGISSAKAEGENVISFKLSYKNPEAHNLLTFPIASRKSDKKGYPIGSGRYVFGEADGNAFLELNKGYKDFTPHITKITLVNITAADSIDNAINIGNISYTYRDLSSGAKTKINSNKKAVNLNNLVYIGLNCYAGITSDENIRKAISLAIDRDTLVKSAYQGYARAATSPFHPVSALGKETTVFSSSADVSAAKQAITQSRYKNDKLKIDILVGTNSEKTAVAMLVKQQLEAAGFKVTINREKNEVYKSKVDYKSYNIYIGETRLTNDMILLGFFTEKGATSSGINTKEGKSAKSYRGYLNSTNEIGKFILDFQEEIPFIPLLYREGMICWAKSMHGDMQGYEGNYFSNIEDWYFN